MRNPAANYPDTRKFSASASLV